MIDYDLYEDERAELAAIERAKRRYEKLLMAHPDCRDPDHPGCEQCMEDDGEEE